MLRCVVSTEWIFRASCSGKRCDAFEVSEESTRARVHETRIVGIVDPWRLEALVAGRIDDPCRLDGWLGFFGRCASRLQGARPAVREGIEAGR